MRGKKLVVFMLGLAGAIRLAAQQTPPRRTMGARTENAATSDQQTSAAALAQFRKAWDRMTPVQQKAFVSSGGYTPEQYERMLTQAGARAGQAREAAISSKAVAPANPANEIDPSAIESLGKSLRNLDAIRDGNLSKVQKDGCPPEVASRIADLKGRLQNDDYQLNGVEAAAAPAEKRIQDNAAGADPLALAAAWFKRPANLEPASANAGAATAAESHESKLLDAVLSGTTAAPAQRIDARPPQSEASRSAIQQDKIHIQAELAQLSGACAAPKR